MTVEIGQGLDNTITTNTEAVKMWSGIERDSTSGISWRRGIAPEMIARLRCKQAVGIPFAKPVPKAKRSGTCADCGQEANHLTRDSRLCPDCSRRAIIASARNAAQAPNKPKP